MSALSLPRQEMRYPPGPRPDYNSIIDGSKPLWHRRKSLPRGIVPRSIVFEPCYTAFSLWILFAIRIVEIVGHHNRIWLVLFSIVGWKNVCISLNVLMGNGFDNH